MIAPARAVDAQTRDKWFATARAQAAMRELQVDILTGGEILIRRGAWTKSVRSREELAALLRLHGCANLADPPQEPPPP